ncbi:MAG: cytochrome c [Candidatus Rokubacteria bacterium]|nr:cytochrome c [Candidatus Rokubacteria bacterium]
MLTSVWLLGAGLTLANVAWAQAPSPASIATGGRLYDKWWKEVAGMKAPAGDHPVWALQTTNKRKGETTWRCKECHGWDYRGKDGIYGSGSHKTGFPGVLAAQANSVDQLMKGFANPKHGFASVLNDATLTHLANFLKHGLVDLTPAIDRKTKKPVKADEARGKQLSVICAACHGADGKTRNFGKPDDPEYVGTVARENPWEFVHKVRFGQPGSDPPMPAGVEIGWSLQDVLDVLAYSQTLPEK